MRTNKIPEMNYPIIKIGLDPKNLSSTLERREPIGLPNPRIAVPCVGVNI